MFGLLGAETMTGEGVSTKAGEGFKNMTDEWVEGMDLGKYTLIYGASAWVFAIVPLVTHFFVNNTASGKAFEMIVYIH